MAKTAKKQTNREVNQLHRISGQLVGVERMIDNKQSLCEILQQREAISGNIKSLQKVLLDKHVTTIKDKDFRNACDYLLKIS